MSSIQEDNNS